MNQTLKLVDRTTLELNNVNKVISFNNKEFLLETPYGNLKVLGKNLTVGKMDTEKKELIIKGNIDSINYLSTQPNNTQKESVFKKLFK